MSTILHHPMSRANQPPVDASECCLDDICSACHLVTALHWDTSGSVWIGCEGAALRVGLETPDAPRIVNAKEHAILAAGNRLAALLYEDETWDPDNPWTATELSAKEMRCVIEMVTTALVIFQQAVQHGTPPVAGSSRAALDAGKAYRPSYAISARAPR